MHEKLFKVSSSISSPASSSFFLYFFKLFIFTLFYFIILYWFCHTLTWIHHGCTCNSKHEPPLPLPSPQHPSGSTPCTSPKHAVSCIEHRLAIHFLHDKQETLKNLGADTGFQSHLVSVCQKGQPNDTCLRHKFAFLEEHLRVFLN